MLTTSVSLRDGHKKGWLEDFRGHQGLTKVHAFGQLSDAREYLRSMLHEPPVTRDVEVSTPLTYPHARTAVLH